MTAAIASAEPLLVDTREAARRLMLSERGVQQLIYAGRLRSVLIGTARRIAVADLVAFVERLRSEQAPAMTFTTTRQAGGAKEGRGVGRGIQGPALLRARTRNSASPSQPREGRRTPSLAPSPAAEGKHGPPGG